MAHHYTTATIILDSRPQGELHRTLTIYTKEFGLLHVIARSARLPSSKLRGLLQKSFIGLVTLVRGKRSWKVVGAVEEFNLYYTLRNQSSQQYLMSRMYWLLQRLVKGEERNDRLYSVLDSFSRHLVTESTDVHEHLPALERLTALRMLSALGYATTDASLAPLIHSDDITNELLMHTKKVHMLATKEINQALEATHL